MNKINGLCFPNMYFFCQHLFDVVLQYSFLSFQTRPARDMQYSFLMVFKRCNVILMLMFEAIGGRTDIFKGIN